MIEANGAPGPISLQIVTEILWTLGGAGVVIAALSHWLGRVWANRILEKERHRNQIDLEYLRTDLTTKVQLLENELVLQRERNLSVYELKLNLYREAVEPIVPVLVDMWLRGPQGEISRKYEEARLRAYSHLAMFAPSRVLDAYSELTDYLCDCFEAKAEFDWPRARDLATEIFNTIRDDVELAKDPVSYKGHR